MATYLDNTAYARFKGSNLLADLNDTFHTQLDDSLAHEQTPPMPAGGGTVPPAASPADLAAGGTGTRVPPIEPPSLSAEPPGPPFPVAPVPLSSAASPPPSAALPPMSDTPTLVAPPGAVQPPGPLPTAPGSTDFQSALEWANRQLNKPYIWGSAGGRSDLSGNAPGYDCSGFVSQFYHQMGRSVPAQTTAAYAATSHVDARDAQPGDIVEWMDPNHDPTQEHMAIYLGNGKIIQSGGSSHQVNIGNLTQFGAGSFEFRRARGGPTAASNAAAIDHVSNTVDAVTPGGLPTSTKATPSTLDQLGADFHKQLDDTLSNAGQAKDQAGATLANLTDSFGQKLNEVLSGPVQRVTEGLDPNARGNQAIIHTLTDPQPFLQNAVGAQTKQLQTGAGISPYEPGQQNLSPSEEYAQARGIASGLSQVVAPESLGTEAARGTIAAGAGPVAEALESFVKSKQPAQADANFAAGGLPGLLAKLGDKNPLALFDQPGPGRVALSSEQVADHMEALQAQHTANDARINELENRLSGRVYGGQEAGQGGVVRPPWAVGWTSSALESYARSEGLNPYVVDWWHGGRGEAAKAAESGYKGTGAVRGSAADAKRELAQLQAEQHQILEAADQIMELHTDQTPTLYRAEPQTAEGLPWDYNAADAAAESRTSTDTNPSGGGSHPQPAPGGLETPLGQTATSASAAPGRPAGQKLGPGQAPPNKPPTDTRPPGPPPAPEPGGLPPEQFDPSTGEWINNTAAARQTVNAAQAMPLGGGHGPWSDIFEGQHTLPSAERPGGPPPPPPPGRPPVVRAGITDETIQLAHERIDRAVGDDPYAVDAAHTQLDNLLADGASPAVVARFLLGLEGKSKVSRTSILRSVRTGSMAGGLTTEGKVSLSPLIQTAMRAPVGAINALRKGRPGDIAAGLQGGIAGLAEGAQDALQTIRYGTTYRAALTGGAQGGYGFKPGLDVLGSSVASRVAGTAALGLVRTHGALADLSAGIGRGAALAQGAGPEAAAEAGQQWALRSGNYGTVGQALSNVLEGLKQTNPTMDVVGQILVPFFRVSYNALVQGVERSPVGLLGTGLDVARSKLPAGVGAAVRGPYAAGADASHVTPLGDRLTNNAFGVGLATVGLTQAAQGNITGQRPPQGAPQWSIRVPVSATLGPLEPFAKRDASTGNLWLPMRALGPAGEALAQSAILYESARDGKGDVAKTATLAAGAYVGHVEDESWLRSIGDVFSMLDDARNLASRNRGTATQAMKDVQYRGGSLAKSFLPQATLASQALKAGQGVVTRRAPVPAAQTRTTVPGTRYEPRTAPYEPRAPLPAR